MDIQNIGQIYLVDLLFVYCSTISYFLQMIYFTYRNIFNANDLMNILNSIHECYNKFFKSSKLQATIWCDVILELVVIPTLLTTTTYLYFDEESHDISRVGIYCTISTLMTTWIMGMSLPFQIYMILITDLLNQINVNLMKLLTSICDKSHISSKLDITIQSYYMIQKIIPKLVHFYEFIICTTLFSISFTIIWQIYRCFIFFDETKFNFGLYKTIITFTEFIAIWLAFIKSMIVLCYLADMTSKNSETTKIIIHNLHIRFEHDEIINKVSFMFKFSISFFIFFVFYIQIDQFSLNLFYMDMSIAPFNIFKLDNQLIVDVSSFKYMII